MVEPSPYKNLPVPSKLYAHKYNTDLRTSPSSQVKFLPLSCHSVSHGHIVSITSIAAMEIADLKLEDNQDASQGYYL